MGSLSTMPDPTDNVRLRRRRARRGARPLQLARDLRLAATTALLLFTAGAGWYFLTRAAGFQSDEVAIKHLASAAGCNVGEIVGIAPSRRGQAGYWAHLDADGDGLACESIKVKGVLIKGR